MKKHTIFIFLSIIVCTCFIGCPPETNPGKESYNCNVEPGKIESIPSDVSIIIDAKEKLIADGDLLQDQIAFFYFRKDGNYDGFALWMWADGGAGENNYKAFAEAGYSTVSVAGGTVGYMKFNNDGSTTNGAIALTGEELAVIQNKGNFNFIVVKDNGSKTNPNWDTKDYPADLYWDIMQSNHFGVVSGSGNVFSIERNAKPRICGAVMLSENSLRVQLSQRLALYPTPKNNGFSLVADDGSKVSIKDCYSFDYYESDEIDRQDNYTSNIYMKIAGNLDLSKSWSIKNSKFNPVDGFLVSPGPGIKAQIKSLKYEGDDLGLTINGSKASFKVFAPVATKVNVLLFDTFANAVAAIDNITGAQKVDDALTGCTRFAMTLDKNTGVWSLADADISGKTYYVYELENLGKVYRVCDINAKVAGPDSIAAQLIDIDDSACQPTSWEASYTNPFGNSGSDTKSYADAVIYEMHIRDWSKGLDKDGKFDNIAEGLNGSMGQHLQELGITHVQILPMFDYAQTNSDPDYNWGYNPYHYNVPEGRYVINHDNGGHEAVKQMRGMIKAFHDLGIAVNMDVVYNHTSGTKTGSLYDMTVPFYYYRLVNGEYSNGSGCGNETDSSAPMYRKYMIDSLKHWMTDYHINGFRFDLMGLHEQETMSEIYDALKNIDKNVMVYGEPWNGGSSPVVHGVDKNGIDKCCSSTTENGVACFNDDYRNAIKGGEFGGFKQGHVQGTYAASAINLGLKGSIGTGGFTKVLGRSINYVECHDNYTLFDKLDISIKGGTNKTSWVAFDSLSESEKTIIKEEDKLAAAFVFLAQGTPFINGGQEFMRTKQGDENSYVSSDDINGINIGFITKYNDVYLTYKGLISLRKAYDCFRGNYKDIKSSTVSTGVTKYTLTTQEDETIAVFFNAKDETYEVKLQEKYNTKTATPIDISSGSIINGADVTCDIISAKGFKIYKFTFEE